MTKAEAIALLELNATPEQYITEEEYRNAWKDTANAELKNDDTPYGGNVSSIIVDKHKYSLVAVHKQDWTGDWDTDSVVYVKQHYLSFEEIQELIGYVNNTSMRGPVDYDGGPSVQ